MADSCCDKDDDLRHLREQQSNVLWVVLAINAGLFGAEFIVGKDVEWGVRALLTNTVSDEQRHVQFKCDSSLPKEVFEPVLKAIAEGGGIIEAVGENDD